MADTAKSPDQISVNGQTQSSGNLKKILIIVGVLLLLCCVVCGVLSLIGGNFMSQFWGRFSDEFNQELSKYEGELRDYENNLQDLSGDDENDLSVFGDQEWPADLPASIPQFSGGKLQTAFGAKYDDSKIWTITYTEVPAGAFSTYIDQLIAAGWPVNKDEDLLTALGSEVLTKVEDGSGYGLTVTSYPTESTLTISVVKENYE